MSFQPLPNKPLPSTVNLHLQHTQEMLDDILVRGSASTQPTQNRYYQTPNYYHSPYSYQPESFLSRWLFPRTVHHYHHTSTESSSKTKKKEDHFALGIVLAVSTTALLYIVGKEVGTQRNAVADLDRLSQDRKIIFKQLERGNYNDTTLYQIADIMDLEKEILEIYKSSSNTSLCIKGVTLAGSATALYGAFAVSSAYLTGGASLAFGGALAWAFNAGIDTTDKTVHNKALYLLNEVQNLKASSRL